MDVWGVAKFKHRHSLKVELQHDCGKKFGLFYHVVSMGSKRGHAHLHIHRTHVPNAMYTYTCRLQIKVIAVHARPWAHNFAGARNSTPWFKATRCLYDQLSPQCLRKDCPRAAIALAGGCSPSTGTVWRQQSWQGALYPYTMFASRDLFGRQIGESELEWKLLLLTGFKARWMNFVSVAGWSHSLKVSKVIAFSIAWHVLRYLPCHAWDWMPGSLRKSSREDLWR